MNRQEFEVGSRARFGVSLWVYPELGAVFADVILWLLGRPLGRRDDPTAVYAFACALEGMSRVRRDDDVVDLLRSSVAATWARLTDEEERFKPAPVEFFDDYEMYCVGDEESVRFLWRSRTGEDGTVNDAVLPRQEVDPVVRRLRMVYQTLASS
jgi:hypothetical protein